jgi:hypothetical protein
MTTANGAPIGDAIRGDAIRGGAASGGAGADAVVDVVTGRALERQISAKRREIARLRHEMRLCEAEMQAQIAAASDATTAATRLLEMRRQLARLIVERDALMDGLMFRPEAR